MMKTLYIFHRIYFKLFNTFIFITIIFNTFIFITIIFNTIIFNTFINFVQYEKKIEIKYELLIIKEEKQK